MASVTSFPNDRGEEGRHLICCSEVRNRSGDLALCVPLLLGSVGNVKAAVAAFLVAILDYFSWDHCVDARA